MMQVDRLLVNGITAASIPQGKTPWSE